LFFQVEGNDGVEAIDQGSGGKLVGVGGEGAFFEALLGGEELTLAAGGVD
jgi:hypothetical protein